MARANYLQQRFDAVRYGARRGGVVSASPSIQAAVSAASAAGGGVVWLPAGVYLIDATIALASGVTLAGEGPGTVLHRGIRNAPMIRALGSAGAVIPLTNDALAGPQDTGRISLNTAFFQPGEVVMVVSDAYFAGEHATVSSANDRKGELAVIRRIDSLASMTLWTGEESQQNCLVDDYLVSDNAGARRMFTIDSVGLRDLTIIDPEFGDHGAADVAAVQFWYSRGVQVRGVDFHEIDSRALQFISCYGFTVDGCDFRDIEDGGPPYGYGVEVSNACAHGVVSATRFDRCRHAFTTTSGFGKYGQPKNVLVTGCVARATTLHAFDTHSAGHGIAFEGCSTESCYVGFRVRSRFTVVCGCTVNNSSYDSIAVDTEGHGCKVIGNTVNRGFRGIRVEDSKRVVVMGNSVAQTGREGLIVTTGAGDNCDYLQVVGNSFTNCGQTEVLGGGFSSAILVDHPAAKGIVMNNIAANLPSDETYAEPWVAGQTGFLLEFTAAADDWQVRGNVLQSPDPAAGVTSSVVDNSGSATNIVEVGNVVWNP